MSKAWSVSSTREQLGVCVPELDHAVGVGAPLRNKRAGNRGERKQEQQQQRRAHARQLPPEEAHVTERVQLGLRWARGRGGRVEVIRGPGQNR